MGEELYRGIVEESPDIATIIDAEGTITYMSPSVRRTLGYEPEELVGEDGFELQHPDHRENVADAIAEVTTNPEETTIVETRFRRADGSWCWIESTLKNRLDDEDIGGILVSSRDISERKRQERRYQEVAREYETLLETVEDGIFFLDVESSEAGHTFRFERVNRAYEEQTGIDAEDMEGRTPVEVFGEDLGGELQSNYHRCAVAREPITYQEEVPVETGARFWQTNLAPVLTDGEVTRIVGITRNVTERVERERRLENQTERLEEFASVVSHDLRSPLTVAQGRTELLAEEYDSEHLPAIRQSLDRMAEIISDTLTLARQGEVVADTEPIALVNIVGSCWKGVSTDEATIEIEDEVTIHGDRSRLQNVFENLFRNAVEHGGPDVTVRVGRIGDRGIYVEDTGPGIPEGDRETVFEPGHSSAEDGTGFGLTIVRRIAEAHGWNVEIVDGEDGGARFEFTGVDIARE
ncbi:PAS domain S-box protein [Natronomonas marina]|jgi:PAS domain S-box-containing protein|uniref:PAS domain S-box protein n=1 Tax=Natronomonas marina TaxID=2961939 RepID=UPI0020CA178F|nr:PAS domain S-box protein [Natronomonas marina]